MNYSVRQIERSIFVRFQTTFVRNWFRTFVAALIYILYRDRKPSQHVTVGLAWGSPQSVIQPDLEYAALTFTPSMNAGQGNRLLAVWRKAIRCAAGVGYQDEVTPLISEFRLTNIVDRWIVQSACYVRRCVKQEAPSTSCAKLQRPAHRHCTWGQENSFRPFLANNRAGLVSFRTVLHLSGTLYLLTFEKHHHCLPLREGFWTFWKNHAI